MSDEIPQITGPGRFAIDVAGESYYTESFAAICGPRCEDGVDLEVRARLILQDDNPHDKQAVRVEIQGHPVGHLPREVARDFRRAVRYGQLSIYETFECAAIIRGGWDRGNGDAGHYGVRLDLPQDDD
ncbi:HIRAN domain-containing protein [Massilia timonae]|uniref:HIRAN domain-containing protein n=1 Tax=Massilia timonae TaxID=47229 RepID=UPI002355FBE1|nr:HIRAN domain-containing protein [Massilia timonae]